MSETRDVIVVGAGFAGLSAAAALREAGLSLAVLEARDRVGGRIAPGENALGERCDVGGQYICDDMPRVMELARVHGKTLISPPGEGRARGQPSSLSAQLAGTPDPSAASFDQAWEVYQELFESADLPPDLRDKTVAQWIACLAVPAEVKAALTAMLTSIWCVDLAGLPLWHLAAHCRCSKTEVTELQYFLGETLHSLAVDLAAPLGGDLHTSCPVENLSWQDTGVHLTAGGRPWQARQVILAIPPVVVPRISFSPVLPVPLSRALGAYHPGDVIKILLRYDRAFWRDVGWSGTVQWSAPAGLYVGDASPAPDRPQLVCFVAGPLTREMIALTDSARRDRILALIADAIGPAALTPRAFLERSWLDDTWSGGGYSATIADMTAWDADEVLRAGRPPISFAATELALAFPGYVEGAIAAGRAAAEGVIRRLGR